MEKTRRVYVLLTRFHDNGAKVIHAFSGCRYTHASIGLEEDMNTFYSFVYKGFIVEQITRYLKPDRAPYLCRLYELSVTQESYDAIKKTVRYFEQHKGDMQYSKLGLVMSMFRIPYKRNFRFFCSQFVADVLQYSKATTLKKDSSLYLPGDLSRLDGMRLCFQGNLQTFVNHYGITASKETIS